MQKDLKNDFYIFVRVSDGFIKALRLFLMPAAKRFKIQPINYLRWKKTDKINLVLKTCFIQTYELNIQKIMRL